MRSFTPVVVVIRAARRHVLPPDNGAPAIVMSRAFSYVTMALAAGELVGDKLKRAPDRIVPTGLSARVATGAAMFYRRLAFVWYSN